MSTKCFFPKLKPTSYLKEQLQQIKNLKLVESTKVSTTAWSVLSIGFSSASNFTIDSNSG